MHLPSTLLVVWVLVSLQLVLGSPQEYRLPRGVRPRHYDLALLYDLDPTTNFSFFANVDILLTADESTSEIVLHAQNFTIATDKVILIKDGTATSVRDVKLDDTLNFLTISLAEPLQEKQNYTLRIPFYGNLRKGLSGAYISSYINQETQEEEYLVTTQFEPTWARLAFPCFDEPAFKATFRLSIGHHRDFWAITNMPLRSCSDENALESIWPWTTIAEKFRRYQQQFTWQHYSRSLPMSTYVVAWVVSKFESIESPPGLSVPKFRTWARPDALNQVEYASTIAPKVLSHYENWFGVAYPLPKMDLVAIPDFATVAMENWGIITFHEPDLLYDKAQSSFLRKEKIAITIAHELVHQWFGDRVTMKWWSDIWLYEGFATFMSSLAVAVVEPDWKAEETLAVRNILTVLDVDVLETSHPVSVPVEDPDSILKIFDVISYEKGSSLIRMMTKFLGVDVFRQAINSYLLKYSYNNAEQDDLWNELTLAIQAHGGLTRNVTVKTVMDSWTKQIGYPVLNVTRDYSAKTAYITQKRYMKEGVKDTSTPSWPLNVLNQKEAGEKPRPLQWLAADEGVATGHEYQHGSGPGEWVLFNADMIAPYRVNYDEQNWRLLALTLQSSQYSSIPVLSRVQLLSDAFAFAWNNFLDYELSLNIVSYLSRETDFLPLSTALSRLSAIGGMLRRSADFGVYQLFVRSLIADTYLRAGGLAQKKIINGHDLNSVKMQVMLSRSACHVEVPGCKENAVQLFQQWMETENPDENNPIPLDLQATVYCVAMAKGGAEHWNFLLSRMRHTNAAASNTILNALACTREVWQLSQYLEMVVTEGSELRRHAGRVVNAVLTSSVGYYVAKEFFYSRIEDIHRACGGRFQTIVEMVKDLTRQFTTQRELDELKEWRERNKKYLVESEMNVNQAIEAAQVNVNWMEKNRRHMVELMKKSVQTKKTKALAL